MDSSEQPDLVKEVPAHGRGGFGIDDLQTSLPTQTILLFCGSLRCFYCYFSPVQGSPLLLGAEGTVSLNVLTLAALVLESRLT